ncbi:nitroreductase family protein [Mycolicibacterium nivoides]|uniref:nitroreductase family protein n=1 Tax=Mycolicibacterium nivoides TaxID=2487344 RepID=UPI003C2E5697
MNTPTPTDVPVGHDAPIFDVMSTMRAMRRLKPDPVPQELLTKVVEAATWAPSGSNAQGYQFVVVTDRDQIAKVAELWKVVSDYYIAGIAQAVPPGSTEEKHGKLRAALQYQRDHFHETPALIVACYDMGPYWKRLREHARNIAVATARLGPLRAATIVRQSNRFSSMGEAASIYPGVQNMLLAARALGLGATLTTWHHFLEPEFKAALGIPRTVHTYAIVPIGWPLGRLGPVTRHPVANVIHHDTW